MARKSKAKRMKKSTPVQRFLYYDLIHSANAGEDAHYIDIGKDLSAMNRRLYRQGMVYHVANITLHDSQGSARALFSTAPNTWAVHSAWNAAFKAWKGQRADVLDNTVGSLSTPKWSDFKVYLNKEHVKDSDWPVPIEDEQQAIVLGEWNYADLSFVRAGTQYDNHAIGLMGAHQIGSSVSSTSPSDGTYDGYVSALEALQELRRFPNTPVDDNSMENSVLLGMGMQPGGAVLDILTEIGAENDLPPYSSEFVGGADNPAADTGAFPARECHIASAYSPIAQVGGFPVPCGLIQVETFDPADRSGTPNTIGMLIEIAPGPYKGVMAEAM